MCIMYNVSYATVNCVMLSQKGPYVGKIEIEFYIARSTHSTGLFETQSRYLLQFLTELLQIFFLKHSL